MSSLENLFKTRTSVIGQSKNPFLDKPYLALSGRAAPATERPTGQFAGLAAISGRPPVFPKNIVVRTDRVDERTMHDYELMLGEERTLRKVKATGFGERPPLPTLQRVSTFGA